MPATLTDHGYRMRFIIISGIDGSGKTCLIERLLDHFKRNGVRTQYVWMRFSHVLCKPVHGVCRLMGLARRYDAGDRKVWRHEFYRIPAFCRLYILLTYIDSWIGAVRLKWLLHKSDAEIVICDRWILDVIVDLAVKCRRPDLIGSPWQNRFFRIQSDDAQQFLLHRDVESVLQARLENQRDPDFALRYQAYEQVGAASEAIRVDNNGSVECAVQQVLARAEISRTPSNN